MKTSRRVAWEMEMDWEEEDVYRKVDSVDALQQSRDDTCGEFAGPSSRLQLPVTPKTIC